MNNTQLNERINELESKLAFQDDLLQTLNDIVSRQELEMQKLWAANKLLKQNFDELKQEAGSGEVANEPPPHY